MCIVYSLHCQIDLFSHTSLDPITWAKRPTKGWFQPIPALPENNQLFPIGNQPHLNHEFHRHITLPVPDVQRNVLLVPLLVYHQKHSRMIMIALGWDPYDGRIADFAKRVYDGGDGGPRHLSRSICDNRRDDTESSQ